MRSPIELQLTGQERGKLIVFRAKGRHSARELNRAHILAALDQKIPQTQISQVLGVERTAVWRTAKAYQEGGLEYALHDLARSGKPRHYHTDQEAEVVALACSQPPAGAKRWTIRLLVQASRRRPKLKQVSRETIRRFLKKTSSNPGAR
jgi:transposase